MATLFGGTDGGQDKIIIWMSLHGHALEHMFSLLSAKGKILNPR